MSCNNIKYILALKQVDGIGDRLAQKILNLYENPEEIFSISKDNIYKLEKIRKNISKGIIDFSRWNIVEDEIERNRKYGFKIISFLDDRYPKNLLNIYHFPTIIYCLGELLEKDNSAISIVGSRFGNNYGKLITRKLTEGLVEKGITIVSGMARGIDTYAHQEAIRFGGRTVAVLGSGLNQIYPPENKNLYKKISENGAVISEFPLDTKPEPKNFPQRNRVISGLSNGVLVVQASKRSGSLITAEFALQQNREVFAVPGNIGSKLSEGTNDLIKKGAKLVQDVSDIVDEIDGVGLEEQVNKVKVLGNQNSLNNDEKNIFNLLTDGSKNIDELFELSGIDRSDLFKILLDLEIKGLIENLPGNLYQAI